MNIFRLNKNAADEYITQLSGKYSERVKFKKTKIDEDDVKIPNLQSYHDLLIYDYNLSQLKTFAKNYKLKVSGNKIELVSRIYTYLHFSVVAIQLQKYARGFLQRFNNKLIGPAYIDRSLCTNDCDFITMEPLDKIYFHQFISYKDIDGFIYGFDIASIYNLYIKSGYEIEKVKNPYNRNIIPLSFHDTMSRLLKFSMIHHQDIKLHIENDIINIPQPKAVELRALELFQNIDSLGNYSDSTWFLSLDRNQNVRFMRHLSDIFNYRAQLTNDMKRNICPPSGNPFWNFNIHYIQGEANIDNIRASVLNVLENLVNTGINVDSKSLGAYYVLSALTLVNETAAEALPWLYQSVAIY
jgi:hypothetical protein